MKGQQLALAVGLAREPSFSNFYPGPNTAAVNTLKELLQPGAGLQLLLHGPAGSGKSHLAQALSHEAQAEGLSVLVLNLHHPLPETSKAALLVVDALETPLNDTATLALIRLLDGQYNRNGSLLLTARQPAHQLLFARPDLHTRVSQAASFGLKPLSDDDRAQLLAITAHARGLHLSDEVAHYLLRHLPRDVTSLLNAVETLDGATLAHQRKLTVPFVQATLLGRRA